MRRLATFMLLAFIFFMSALWVLLKWWGNK